MEMIIRLGLYFGGLALDYLSGEAETPARVKMRAGQLRRAPRPTIAGGRSMLWDLISHIFPPYR